MKSIDNKRGFTGMTVKGLLSSIFVWVAFSGLFLSFSVNAQNNQPPQMGQGQNNPQDDQQNLVNSIAPYKEDVRNAILIASQYPDVLEKMAQLHDQTSMAFQQTIQDYGQKKQGWFYELSRFPDLMHALATMPDNRSKEQIQAMLPEQTDLLKEASWKLYNNHHKDLVLVDNLNQQAERDFRALINPLSPDTQMALTKLVAMPEVISLLNSNLNLTAELSDKYKADPQGTQKSLADLHDTLEAQNKQDLANYQQELAQNPQALQELQQASRDYAQSNGYNNYNPAYGYGGYNNYYNPYSYWFGYPYWYTSANWYPGSFGFSTGFYYGFGGAPVFYGFPSFGFSAWFFGGAYRYYPNLYRQYGHYYYNYGAQRRYYGGINRGFFGAARQNFQPRVYSGGRSNWITNPQNFRGSNNYSSRMGSGGNNGQRVDSYNRSNTNTYHSQSWGNSGGSRGFSGGGFRGGGGGGGFHGGGGGRGHR
ncbi:hypothetical protein SAMN04515674_10552 [Pseudarcicella hirudinis]|uniref:DUF3300 domain-containing protein n=2 Tax=Pseudarcicella hirudinis TaxID=1079859 RepID=A0A1I5SJA8_9BACT|nr:DUF3300 domain-containing protein [Pseudarcicella hirudinis]SFP70825.1 hypothetical protein SAMN04515674_10552 [Pseudarcicella hirudinis]